MLCRILCVLQTSFQQLVKEHKFLEDMAYSAWLFLPRSLLCSELLLTLCLCSLLQPRRSGSWLSRCVLLPEPLPLCPAPRCLRCMLHSQCLDSAQSLAGSLKGSAQRSTYIPDVRSIASFDCSWLPLCCCAFVTSEWLHPMLTRCILLRAGVFADAGVERDLLL